MIGIAIGLLMSSASSWATDEAGNTNSVSTSPIAARFPIGHDAEHQTAARRDQVPLTRAAARRRIEAVTPVEWLARFGSVEVQRRK